MTSPEAILHTPAARALPPRIAVQPSRIRVTDAWPSLSYRIFVDGPPGADWWVELAFAPTPKLFAPSARAERTAETFFSTRPLGRLFARRGQALFVFPPWALARFAGAARLYHAAAAFKPDDPAPAALLLPDAAAVYVDLGGLGRAALGRASGTPNPRGGLIRFARPDREAALSEAALVWAGDAPRPGAEAAPYGASAGPSASAAQYTASPPSSRPPARASAASDALPDQQMGIGPMHRPGNGILHQSGYRNGNGNGMQAPAPPPVARHGGGNGNGNGNGAGGQMRQPNGGARGAAPGGYGGPARGNGGNGNGAAPQPYRSEDYDDGYGPMAEPQGLLDWLSSTSIGGVISEIGAFLRRVAERHESFVVGVPDASFFPFSAICRIDGPKGQGTGFYIAPDRILTAAHVLSGQGQVTVTAGQQGAGDAGLARFQAASADWTLHPGYDGSSGFDVAVIRTSTPPPAGLHFSLINYSPAPDTPLAICGYGATCDYLSLDSEIQHIDVGALGDLRPDFESMEVAVLACHGTSGSPAFVEGPMMSGNHDPSLIPVMGILVSGASDIDNNICLLTPDKIDWALAGSAFSTQQSYRGGRREHRPARAPARSRAARPMRGASAPMGVLRAPAARSMEGDALSARSLGDAIAEIGARLRAAYERMESFIVGVPDTSFFPFSAVCHLEMDFGGDVYFGSGFYVGPGRVLTVGHNLWDRDSGAGPDQVRVRAGRNGASSLSDFTVTPENWEVHPTYLAQGGPDFDLGVIHVPVQPPAGMAFDLINFSPAPETPVAICGHGMRNFNNDAVLDHTRQHLDVGLIGELLQSGEAMRMEVFAMRGHSGSPCFVEGGMGAGGGSAADMPVMGVLSEIDSSHDGYICLLTPDKIQWARGQSLPEYAGGMGLRGGARRPRYARPQQAQAAWVPIVAAAGSAAANAGITALANSSGDIAWSVQRMDGWMRPGQHPTPTVPVPPDQLREQEVDLASPIYDGVLGDVYAHFRMRFAYDGTGIGAIRVDPAPYDSSDPIGKGLKVRMMIEPASGTFHAQGDPDRRVAGVRVTMHYEYEHTFADSTFVQYVYTLYGDGTYESAIDNRAGPLSRIDVEYAPGHPFRR